METWKFPESERHGPGEWENEPDKAVWIDPVTDLDCMIVRNHSGALCGYVGVGPGHVMHGAPYMEPSDNDDLLGRIAENIAVHGGLTYADRCREDGHICHVPLPGRPHDVWWFGFDCAHSGDYVPFVPGVREIVGRMPREFETYRNFDYVKSEVDRLALQLAEIASDFSDCLQ